MSDLARGSVAEFIGTFALVFFGAGSIVLTQDAIGAGDLVTVAMAHGLVLTVFVTACMYLSGAQFNPAVSIGLMAIRKQGPAQTGAFILAQLLAAACGAGMIVFVFGEDLARAARVGATLPAPGLAEQATPLVVLATEVLLTFALMFVIMAAVVDERAHRLGGFCVGLVVATCIVGFGPLTGASMNPARSFGPAIYGYWDMHWVYWVAPIIGAVLAAVVYRFVWEKPDEHEPPVPPLHEGDEVAKRE